MLRLSHKLGLDKKIVLLILGLTVIFSIPLYNQGIPSGHDLIYHFSRIVGSFELLKRGVFPAKILPGFYFNYGYPVGLFYPTGLLYIASFLLYVGLDFISSYKVLIIFISLLTTLSIYLSSYGIFKSKLIASYTSVFYTLSIYRVFTDLYYRGALGEYIAFVFIPLAFWGLFAIINNEDKYGIILGLGMFGLLTSHIISTVLTTILLVLFALFNFKAILENKKSLFIIVRTALFVALLSCYYWLPMLEIMLSDIFQYQTPWTNLSLNLITDMRQLFYISPSISIFPFGYEVGLVIVILVLIIFKRKIIFDNKFTIYAVIIFIVSFIFTSNIIPVEYLMIFNFIQFPWRVFIFITFFGSVIASYGLAKVFKSRNVFIFVLAAVSINFLYSVNYYFNVEMKDYKYDAFPRYSIEYHFAEFLPVLVDMDKLMNEEKLIRISQAIDISFESDLNTYYIFFDQGSYKNTILEVPLIYYQGYAAYYMNESESGFLEVSKSDNSLININLKDIKSGSIKVFYNGTRLQKLSFYISLLSMGMIIIYSVKKRVRK